jgi:anti-anti-sigma factor
MPVGRPQGTLLATNSRIRQQSYERSEMMQQTDVIFHLQQQNAATSMSELHESLSALPEQLLTQANSATTSTIILNCSELESINSHGINLFIMLLIYSQRQQNRLQVLGLSEHNQYIFEITRLSEFIEIVSTQTQTVAAVRTIRIDNSTHTGGTGL